MIGRLLSRRALAVALLASVGLNLFLASVVIGHWTQERSRSWDVAAFIERRAAGLPSGDADMLREVFGRHRADLEARFDRRQAAREHARAALQAEPFSEESFAAALSDVRFQTTALQQLVHELYLETAPKMSGEGRRSFLERRQARSQGRE